MNEFIDQAELALTVQALVRRGWEFVEVNSGEERLGISPWLVIRKAGETKNIYDMGELHSMLEEYLYKEWSEESVRTVP